MYFFKKIFYILPAIILSSAYSGSDPSSIATRKNQMTTLPTTKDNTNDASHITSALNRRKYGRSKQFASVYSESGSSSITTQEIQITTLPNSTDYSNDASQVTSVLNRRRYGRSKRLKFAFPGSGSSSITTQKTKITNLLTTKDNTNDASQITSALNRRKYGRSKRFESAFPGSGSSSITTQENQLTTLPTTKDKAKDASQVTSALNRRQYGQPKQLGRSHDDILRLMSQYKNMVKKYGPGKQVENGQSNQLNLTDRLYVGQRGPLRHNPRWKNYMSTKSAAEIKREKEDSDEGPTPPAAGAGGSGGPGSPGGPDDQNDPGFDMEAGDQVIVPQGCTPDQPPNGTAKEGQWGSVADRFTVRRTTTRRRRRTMPARVAFQEQCDYLAYYCLKAFDTGKICARTLYMIHHTFENYCMVDYVNCMERYDVWQIAHMGECFSVRVLTEYVHYPYLDDYFLDNYYIVEDM